MKLVDANVLIYAVNVGDSRHEVSRSWLDDSLQGGETVGFAWTVVLAFLRLTTKVGLFPSPLTSAEAVRRVREWLAQPAAVIAEPSPRHLDVLAGLLIDAGTGGNLVADAHLAAIALAQGATVVTFDTDFARFHGVESEQPTAR